MEQFLQVYDTFQDAHPTYQGIFVAVLSKGNIVVEDVKHMNKFENTQEVHACKFIYILNVDNVIIQVLFVMKPNITLLQSRGKISIIVHDLAKPLLIGLSILRLCFIDTPLYVLYIKVIEYA